MMTQRLTGKHLSLLLALQEAPMETVEKLAEKVGYSRTTVSQNLKWLAGESKDSKKSYFRVAPELDETALGLETVDVFFRSDSFPEIKQLETLCDKHPYTKYRARCYGGNSGLFAQFRIPIGTVKLIDQSLQKYCKLLSAEYEILPTLDTEPAFSTSRLQHWDSKTFTWNFDWDEWFTFSSKGRKNGFSQSDTERTELLSQEDIMILSHLARGSRRKNVDIIRALKKEGIEFTSQDFSRRLQMLRDNFIMGYHVFIDPDAFDLYSNVILSINCEESFGESLRKSLLNNPPPFRSTLKVNDDFSFWYLRLPPSHLSSLLNNLRETVYKLDVTMVDYHMSEVYALWAEAFDEEAHTWKSDEQFMVDF
ncbi:MAG: hypothetical protein GF411_12720 [Candidatus Lokiarchaeota archaeon]|nr:hypothetical protein [Candidatus Lokiarchaeota archaeon]